MDHLEFHSGSTEGGFGIRAVLEGDFTTARGCRQQIANLNIPRRDQGHFQPEKVPHRAIDAAEDHQVEPGVFILIGISL